MNYMATFNTDIGIRKKTNQDSLAIKIIETPEGQATFAIVCDGMGGLEKGEVASKEVIYAFCSWFENEFIEQVKNDTFSRTKLTEQWNDIIQTQNVKLGQYGESHGLQLGTTVSAILMYEDVYYIVHVGDSRIYELSQSVVQLTQDQTLVAREIAMGRLTEEEAEKDARRSILLQCVGASRVVEPAFISGDVKQDAVYLLCSDGFRHKISDEEMYDKLGPEASVTEEDMKYGCVYLTELVKNRRESDNITVAVVKTS